MGMKHLRKFNENEGSGDNKIFISGHSSYSSPFSTSGLSVIVGQKYYNHKEVPGESSIHFQTNEHGVTIDSSSELDNLINFLMEVKEKMY